MWPAPLVIGKASGQMVLEEHSRPRFMSGCTMYEWMEELVQARRIRSVARSFGALAAAGPQTCM